METTEHIPFDNWCIIDLYGHQQIAGHVTEQSVAGAGFIRVDVPEMGDQPAYSRMFGPGAIYSIIPTDETIARAFAARNVGAPIQPWQLKRRALPSGERDEEEDDDDPRQQEMQF